MEDFGHESAAPIFSNQKTLRAQQQAEPPQTQLELDIAAYICAQHNHANTSTRLNCAPDATVLKVQFSHQETPQAGPQIKRNVEHTITCRSQTAADCYPCELPHAIALLVPSPATPCLAHT